MTYLSIPTLVVLIILYALGWHNQPARSPVRVFTAAKFLPFGTVIPMRAGALEVGLFRFFLIGAFTSIVYAAVYVVLGFAFHDQLERVMAFVGKLGVVALLLLVAAAGAYLGWVVLKPASKLRVATT